MLRLTHITLALEHSSSDLTQAIAQRLEINPADIINYEVFKRSHDARKKGKIRPIYQLDVELTASLETTLLARCSNPDLYRPSPDTSYRLLARADTGFPNATQQRPIIIGFGPCGILAALLLAQMELRPIVLERGRAVRERTKDTWAFWRKGELNTESNVQFGEGGAGTFSDGKLYSQVKDKRHLGRKVQMEFVKAGAPEETLFVSKPHIGTFKLVKMVENIRAEIIRLGDEIRFGEKVNRLLLEPAESSSNKHVSGLVLASGETLYNRHVVLAIGHSARDTFQMLQNADVYIEPKPSPIGFRIEHPQSIIDRARFDKQIKGFAMRDALLTAIETRTSSPICIKRDERFESINTHCLYPAGEGAGYAGGILSAGIDSIKVAEAIALSLLGATEETGP